MVGFWVVAWVSIRVLVGSVCSGFRRLFGCLASGVGLLQDALANTSGSEFPYGVIDGSPVPEELVEVFDVGVGDTVVLATDGYPSAFPTMGEAEGVVGRLVREDPLALGELTVNRGVRPGWLSYDDRAYVRLVREGGAT